MREGYVRILDHEIWYSVYGEGRPGSPILAIHGGPGFLSMPQVVSDLGDRHPVYFYDQFGCGRSERAKDPSLYTAEHYIQELSELRSALGLESPILMGFSWGTALACLYALRHGSAGIKAMILCGPYLSTSLWDSDQRANIALMPEAARTAILRGEEEREYSGAYQDGMMAYYQHHVCRLDPWPDFLLDAFSLLNPEVYNKLWGPSEFTITGSLRDLDLLPSLKEIDLPVLLVCGDQDEADPRTVKAYQRAFKNAQMAVIPGASHLHHVEKPEIFLAITRGFLKEIE